MTGLCDGADPPEVVACFDRDWTVSVNPPPDGEAVPLSWVKAYAHGNGYGRVDVWATGNQRLRGEAAIPGVETARAMRADLGLPEVESRASDPAGIAPVNRGLPTRRDRLRMVAELYEESGRPETTLLVVDDVDLSDMDGWTHYTAWEFVPAAREGSAPLSAPETDFTDTPVHENPDEPPVEPTAFDPREQDSSDPGTTGGT